MSLIFLPNVNERKENKKCMIFNDQNQDKQFEKQSKTNEKARLVFFEENNYKEDEPQRSHNIILNELKLNKLMDEIACNNSLQTNDTNQKSSGKQEEECS